VQIAGASGFLAFLANESAPVRIRLAEDLEFLDSVVSALNYAVDCVKNKETGAAEELYPVILQKGLQIIRKAGFQKAKPYRAHLRRKADNGRI
jgi:hypothetical protein